MNPFFAVIFGGFLFAVGGVPADAPLCGLPAAFGVCMVLVGGIFLGKLSQKRAEPESVVSRLVRKKPMLN
jgi:hypothetical protein